MSTPGAAVTGLSRRIVSPVVALLFLTAGCDTLPDGVPPEGALTDNAPPAVESETALHNRLVTQLIAFELASGAPAMAPEADGISPEVARDASRIVGFPIRPDAELRLEAVKSGDGVELVLRDADGKIRWRSGK